MGIIVIEITVWNEDRIPAVISDIELMGDVLNVKRLDI